MADNSGWKRPVRVGFFYDFDLTLTEEFQQYPIFRKFLSQLRGKYGERIQRPDDYWSLCEGGDLAVKWMERFLSDSGDVFGHEENGEIVGLTNRQMREEFAPLIKLAPGLPSWFGRLKKRASSLGIEAENHMITSGIVPLVAGSQISPYLTSIVGGEFLDNGKGIYQASSIVEPSRKVEHFKRICKGEDIYANLPHDGYHINYRDSFYFGDGQSDRDLSRYLKQRGGVSVGVYKPGDKNSFDKCFSVLGSENPGESHVSLILPRDYSEGSILEKKIFSVLDSMAGSGIGCDMDWELVHKWKLNQIRSREVSKNVEAHFNSCSLCQEKYKTDFVFG